MAHAHSIPIPIVKGRSASQTNERTKALASPMVQAKVRRVKDKFARGKLKMGKSGKTVTSPKQATAIAISEGRWEYFKKKHRVSSNAAGQALFRKMKKRNKNAKEKSKKK